jgi:hypothetical protein
MHSENERLFVGAGFPCPPDCGFEQMGEKPRPYKTTLTFVFCVPPHAILNIVVDEEIQFLGCKTVMRL